MVTPPVKLFPVLFRTTGEPSRLMINWPDPVIWLLTVMGLMAPPKDPHPASKWPPLAPRVMVRVEPRVGEELLFFRQPPLRVREPDEPPSPESALMLKTPPLTVVPPV